MADALDANLKEVLTDLMMQIGQTRQKIVRRFAGDFYFFSNFTQMGVAIAFRNEAKAFIRQLKTFSLARSAELQTSNGLLPGPFLTLSINPQEFDFENSLSVGIFVDLMIRFVDAEYREKFTTDPDICYTILADLLGNTFKETSPYAVLAEVQMLRMLNSQGLIHSVRENWPGPDGNVHDFELENCSVEVKSTLHAKDRPELVISSQHQLQRTGDKPLYVVLFQYENTGDLSIGEEVARYESPMIEINALVNKLKDKGIFEGSLSWQKQYHWIENPRFYEVTDDFPRITEDMFVNNQFPQDITKIIYHVDLRNQRAYTFEEFLNRISNN
jgi:hypothetical protein